MEALHDEDILKVNLEVLKIIGNIEEGEDVLGIQAFAFGWVLKILERWTLKDCQFRYLKVLWY